MSWFLEEILKERGRIRIDSGYSAKSTDLGVTVRSLWP